jgi:hypothetical protein
VPLSGDIRPHQQLKALDETIITDPALQGRAQIVRQRTRLNTA